MSIFVDDSLLLFCVSHRKSTEQKALPGITLITSITPAASTSSARSPQHCSTYWTKNASTSALLNCALKHLGETLQWLHNESMRYKYCIMYCPLDQHGISECKCEIYLTVLPVNQLKQIKISYYGSNLKKTRFSLPKIAGNLTLHISVPHSSNL